MSFADADPSDFKLIAEMEARFARGGKQLPCQCGLCGKKGKCDHDFVREPHVEWAHSAGDRICEACQSLMDHAKYLPGDKRMLAFFAKIERPALKQIRRLCAYLRDKRQPPRQDSKSRGAETAESSTND